MNVLTMQKLKTFSTETLMGVLESGDVVQIKTFLDEWGLMVEDDAIVPKTENQRVWNDLLQFYDKSNQVVKILLNSTYGALLNAGSRFFDQRIGQSTTLTGRSITRHMASKTNEMIAGEYDHYGTSIVYGDTDSVTGDTLIRSSAGDRPISELFDNCSAFWKSGDKEYASDPDLMVMSYDTSWRDPYMGHIQYIYRHPVSKPMYEITDTLGNTVTVTEDHSVMVERDGELMSVRPPEMVNIDVLISLCVD